MDDYLIVGAGSAGCVLANRLSADPGRRVTLVESGPPDRSPLIRVPMGFGKLVGNPDYCWHFPVRPIGTSGRREEWVRGRTLGGSSAVNGMIYNRGHRADYDELAAVGGATWAWPEFLRAFTTIEDHALGASGMRGSGGPLGIGIPVAYEELSEDVIAAGEALGLRRVSDPNETDDPRIGYSAATIVAGRRVSAARAFLRPARRRPNLRVLTGVTVDALLFEGDKAVGIRVRRGGHVEELRCSREVVVSAGSLASPKLLQLSGIGPADVLGPLGVEVRVDAPAVGARMREHRCFLLQARLAEDIGYNRLLRSRSAQARSALRYLVAKRGPLAGAAFTVIGFLAAAGESDRPDAQVLMTPVSAEPQRPGRDVGTEQEPGIQMIGYVLRPDSEGRVRITSTDPSETPDIEPNFFATEHDRRVGTALFRRMREIFAQEPVAHRLVGEVLPGAGTGTDDEILDAALNHGYCGYHAIGTCAMGPADDDVVDGQLRVRGVENLRVVDCSVFPTMVSGNLNGPAMAMAFLASELIEQAG